MPTTSRLAWVDASSNALTGCSVLVRVVTANVGSARWATV